jgi:PAT family beta-lactamase induction signal transducer AmpG
LFREFIAIWISFFKLHGVVRLIYFILFLFFFRLAEVQLTRLATFFLKDPRDQGGLALDNDIIGLVYGTFGAGALIVGGILGGILVFRYGLSRLIWPMVLVMHIPNLAFIGLAHWQPESIGWIAAAIIIEQFGYGIGYTAFSIVMLRIADGPHRAAHFAFAAGLAYLGTLLPTFWIGPLQARLGYENFFWWVMLCTIPGFIVTWLVMQNQPKPAKVSG